MEGEAHGNSPPPTFRDRDGTLVTIGDGVYVEWDDGYFHDGIITAIDTSDAVTQGGRFCVAYRVGGSRFHPLSDAERPAVKRESDQPPGPFASHLSPLSHCFSGFIFVW